MEAGESFVFEEDNVVGGRIPQKFHSGHRKGIPQEGSKKGPSPGLPVVGLHVIVENGSYHEVDSSDMAFQICAQTAMRKNFPPPPSRCCWSR